MTLFATAIETAAGKFLPALVLGALAVGMLLPRPRRRAIALGTFLGLAALVHFGLVLTSLFGPPTPDTIGTVLFWLFAAGSVGFGGVLVAQRNPARGAIAFAFVVLSTCGLFLLLAAPFLMAATVIIYAGAIIVTFLFVLMLSQAGGPSDENDRSREPLLGSLAGFALAGLVLFAVYAGSPEAAEAANRSAPVLPAAPITPTDRVVLAEAARLLGEGSTSDDRRIVESRATAAREQLGRVVGFASGETAGVQTPITIQDRLRPAESDTRTWEIIAQADRLRDRKKAVLDGLENNLLGPNPDLAAAQRELAALREDVIRLAGRGELSARNVASIGHALYSEHLIAVELAGTLLLVATIGAVAIAQRKPTEVRA